MKQLKTEPGNQPVSIEEMDDVASPIHDVWRVFRKNKMAIVGAGIIIVFILVAIFAGWLAPEGIDDQKTDQPDAFLHEPSAAYWFGTDEFRRDISSRVMYGARLSLWVGFISVIGAITIDVFLGVIAGFYGRRLDILISRIFDVMLA